MDIRLLVIILLSIALIVGTIACVKIGDKIEKTQNTIEILRKRNEKRNLQ